MFLAKLLDMVRGNPKIDNRRCGLDGCSKKPSFNILGQTKGLRCSPHGKSLGMVNVTRKTCALDGCSRKPSYNEPGYFAVGLYCIEHKKPNMVNVDSKVCSEIGCDITACFNEPGLRRGAYCSEH